MIKKSDGKIGSREVFVLVVYMISLELSDMTPTFLFACHQIQYVNQAFVFILF